MRTEHLALWAEVDLGAVRSNVRALRSLLSPGTELLAVVKANGYGHGDAEVAKAALQAGAAWLAVARVQEGESVRAAGIEAPILLLAEPPRGALTKVIDLNLTPTVYTPETARELSALASKTMNVHVKVDTGMHRYGEAPTRVHDLVKLIDRLDNLEVSGIWSHFAVADDVLNPYTKQQHSLFMEVLDSFGSRADEWLKHLSNSAGTMTFPDAHLDMVRAGIAIYGIAPSPDLAERAALTPAMQIKSRVGHVKRLEKGRTISYGQRYTLHSDASVVTVPMGYADGLRRALTNVGEVLIAGKRFTISGTITMDHFLVDVGDQNVGIGDEVVILGGQGSEVITAEEIAARLDTIAYEVVCGIDARVPRVYLGAEDG